MRKINSLTLLFLLTGMMLSGYSQIYSFRNYGVEHGLQESQVTCIQEGEDDYLWVGTQNGVSRFDGSEFVNFNRFDGLTGVAVTSLLNDGRGGYLWIAFANGTVTKYSYEEKKFFPAEQINNFIHPENIIEKIFQDSNGNIWILVDNFGVVVRKKGKIYCFGSEEGIEGRYVGTAFEDNEKNIFITIDNKIFRMVPSGDTYKAELEKKLKSKRYIDDVIVDESGKFLVATTWGYYEYNPKTKSLEYLELPTGEKDPWVLDLEMNEEGLWLGTEKGGLVFRPKNSPKNSFELYSSRDGLQTDDILSLYTDSEKNLWVGTNGFGLSQVRDRQFRLYTDRDGLHGNQIWSILLDSKRRMWVGTNNGISMLKKKGNFLDSGYSASFTEPVGGRPLNTTTASFEDSRGTVWFAEVGNGLFYYDEKLNKIIVGRKRIKGLHGTVIAIAEDKDKNLWLGSQDSGIFRYNLVSGKLDSFTRAKDGILSDTVTSVMWDGENKIWFSGGYGIFSYSNGKFENYPAITRGKRISFFSIKMDNNKKIWLLSDDLLLYRFEQGRFVNYSFREELKNYVVYAFLPVNDTLIWLGTQMGFMRYNPQKRMYHLYAEKTGYHIYEANQYALTRDSDGDIWLGTIKGLVQYVPGEEKINNIPPKIKLTGIKIFMQDTDFPLKKLTLSYDHNFLTFEYVGISLSDPLNVRYRIKLEGFDKDWLPHTSQRSMTYSNLSFGNYVFKIEAANGDGIWTEKPFEYYITIKPPFWLTWWFLALAIMVAAGVLSYLLQRHFRRIKEDQLLLERRVKARTRELRKEKERVEEINEALRQSESKFRAYTESASSAIFIYNQENFLYGNPAMEEITGYKMEELFKLRFFDIVHPEDRQLIIDRAKARLAGEKPPEKYKFRIVRKDGTVSWLLFTSRRIEYEGQPAGLGTAFDITDLKRAETNLEEEKQLLDVTLKSIQEAIITIDGRGFIVLINNRAKEIFEIESDDPIQRRFTEILKLEDINGKEIPLTLAELRDLKEHSISELRAYYRKKNGEKIFIAYGFAPIFGENKKVTGWVIALRDITEIQLLEEELLKAQKLESIGVLAGGIAHDFNNILTAILGNISLVKLYAEKRSKIYKQIEIAEKAAFRARDLTQQLLTFSKGGMPVLKATKLMDLIKDSAQFVMRGAESKCKFEISPELHYGKVDSGQISQVLQNLILNAKQSMPDGGIIEIKAENITVDIESGIPLTPGEYIKISISDTGKGIPENVQGKIFDPFFTTRSEGNGLGLSSAYYIIKKHRGYITFESKEGEGTTFHVYLPASREADAEQDDKNTVEVEFKGRVLIMDDEESVREVLSMMLGHLGFEVSSVRDGESVIDEFKGAAAEGRPYDAVILDLTIPGGMGGKNAVKEILKIDSGAKVIVASGYSNDEVLSNYGKYGFVSRLHKPFDMKELSNIMQTVCKK
jgi:PAS domain S-box-containing protein